tara:strand:+ start:269 stop:376 length:108 start_codon:yes stop_codon:yes gene_type:complete
MLCNDPKQRITMDYIMNHTWFNEEEEEPEKATMKE